MEKVKKVRRSKKQKVEATKVIIDYLCKGYSLTSVCKEVGVNYETFKCWVGSLITKVDFNDTKRLQRLKRRGFVHEVHDLYWENKVIFDNLFEEELTIVAKRKLMQTITGYEVREVRKEYILGKNGKRKHLKITETTKRIEPSLNSIKYALETYDTSGVFKKKNDQKENSHKTNDLDEWSLNDLKEEKQKLLLQLQAMQNNQN